MSLVIDASVFVAGCLQSDPNHATSLRFLRELLTSRHTAYSPTLLLPECAAAIARGVDDNDEARGVLLLIGGIKSLELVPLSASLAIVAADIATTCRLRGADACYSATARDTQSIILTWDREMLKRVPEGTDAMTPDAWLREQRLT